MIFLALFLIPLLIALVTFFVGKHKVTWHEFIGQVAVSALVALVSVGVMHCNSLADVEIHNGHVSNKQKEKVSCEHPYCCQTCTRTVCSGSGNNRSCHTESYCCRTCYHHPYDIDWAFYTTDAGRDTIRRLSSQGLEEPPRWTKVAIGEPSSSAHDYENYIKAAPDSLFRSQGLAEQYKDHLLQYPGGIYDYYRLDRVIPHEVTLDNLPVWNYRLSEWNDRLGASKEVNMILVVVKNQPHDYFNALEQHWLGGKKNDVVLVISVGFDYTIQWVDSMAWTDHKKLNVILRDSVMDLKTLDPKEPFGLIDLFGIIVRDEYVRKSMDDFKYLEASWTPTVTQWVISMIINLIISIALALWFYHNDFEDWRGNKWGQSRRF